MQNEEISRVQDAAAPAITQLDDAIIDIENLTSRIEDLSLRINGSDTGESRVSTPHVVPSLAGLLQQGPNRLREALNQISMRIDDINKSLFE